MKIRNGFVSNSSSSSFILALPKESKNKIEDVILKKMQIPETSFMFGIAENIAKAFADSVEDKPINIDDEIEDTKKYETSEKWASDWIQNLERYKQKDWVVFRGGFVNDGSEIENMLCYLELKIDDEDLYFDQDGGY